MIMEAIEEIIGVDETIVGFNILKFDVPFMMERLIILAKRKPEFYRIYSKKWFDLYQYRGNGHRSLESCLQEAEIERDFPELSGKDMPSFYKKGVFDKIVQHNKDDLNACEKLFKFLKKRNPELCCLNDGNLGKNHGAPESEEISHSAKPVCKHTAPPP